MLIQTFLYGNLSGKFRRFEDEKTISFAYLFPFWHFVQFWNIHFPSSEFFPRRTFSGYIRINKLFKMVYLKWVHGWKSVKPRSKSNKISYVLIEIHKTMLTNSNLTECRKKPISMYVVHFQWNFHVASCRQRKKNQNITLKCIFMTLFYVDETSYWLLKLCS